MRRLSVVHVDCESGFSGGEVQVMLLVQGLQSLGHENLLICPPGSRIAAAATAAGIETNLLPMRNDADIPAVAGLARMIRARKPDLVHLHTGRATWLGGLAARLAGVPAMTTRRMDRPIRKDWKSRLIYDRLVRRAVAISPGVEKCLIAGGVPQNSIRLIHSSVDPDSMRAMTPRSTVRPHFGATEEDFVVLSLAGLVHRKGLDVLIAAVSHLIPAKVPRLQIWLAGSGPERTALEEQARALGVLSHVQFLGQRDDAADLLGACDVFVLPSRQEGLGVAALEAMAAGKPVIATRVGGLQDAVPNDRAGLLVPPDDSTALADAIATLANDGELRARLGAGGPIRVRERFLASQMVDAYVALYEEVLADTGTLRPRESGASATID